MTNNKTVLAWLDEVKALVNPAEIVWIDGSEEQAEALRAEACSTCELIKLNQDLLPGCYLHTPEEPRTRSTPSAHLESSQSPLL